MRTIGRDLLLRAALMIIVLGISLLITPIATLARTTDDAVGIPLISPWIDHHDRIEETLSRLSPPAPVKRFDLERSGGRGTLDWYPAFGTRTIVDLRGTLIILENAPRSAIERLQDHRGQPLDKALTDWVRQGGHLLIVGGSPSLESYANSFLSTLMGFAPNPDVQRFRKRKRRMLSAGASPSEKKEIYVEYLHEGRIAGARVLRRAGQEAFLIENAVGRGRVTTVLSGAQGQLLPDGNEDLHEWFSSPDWTEVLRNIVATATDSPRTLLPKPPPPKPTFSADLDAFDIRYFSIGNQPYPYAYAKGEARAKAFELKRRGFTSAVASANYRRPLDDQQLITEIAEAGLQIIFYESIRRESGPDRWESFAAQPPRAHNKSGKYIGWDIHDERFRNAPARTLLRGRDYLMDLPIRGIQIIEEFKDGGMEGPALSRAMSQRGVRPGARPGGEGWVATMAVRADETHKTFRRFREIGQALFPEIPQSTYLPGSYWNRPHDYTFRLTTLAESVDELLGPGYGYGNRDGIAGRASVRRSATESWSALRDSSSTMKHVAVYAMGRTLKRGPQPYPNLNNWTETSWTALAHGAQGLAYWALPTGSISEGLTSHHAEMHQLGPWLRAVPRTSAPVALLGSWTSRAKTSDRKASSEFASCYHRTFDALELGFEDVDIVFEERLGNIPVATRAIAIVGAPVISPGAAAAIEAFIEQGGHVFIDPGSASRTEPSGQPYNLATRVRRPNQIHTIPITTRCVGGRLSGSIAARNWRSKINSTGIQARASTVDLATGAALRGSDELAHLYLLNHSANPTQVKATLSKPWKGRNWIVLNPEGGDIVSEGETVATSRHVPPGEALVLASVRRPLAMADVSLERIGDQSRLRVRATDAAGLALADGYPLQIRIETSCAPTQVKSIVLESGVAHAALPSCANTTLPPKANEQAPSIGWMLFDPIGRNQVHNKALDGPAAQ